MRKGHLLLAALLGVAAAALPAIASSETPGISAYDEPGGYGYHSWTPSTATVSPGGVVKFSNPYSEVPHGLRFTGGSAGATPSCAGIPKAATEETGATNWHGECSFSAPGTYTFICTVHPSEMRGTVTVNPNGTTTVTTTTPPPTTTTPTTTTTTTTPTTPVAPHTGSPLVGNPSLGSSRRGGSVKGTLDVSKAGAGDRLEVDLLVKRASLARAGRSTRVRVGRLVRGSVSAGEVSFVVKLDAHARRALERHRRLAVVVKITLTPLDGEPFSVTRTVVEHP